MTLRPSLVMACVVVSGVGQITDWVAVANGAPADTLLVTINVLSVVVLCALGCVGVLEGSKRMEGFHVRCDKCRLPVRVLPVSAEGYVTTREGKTLHARCYAAQEAMG